MRFEAHSDVKGKISSKNHGNMAYMEDLKKVKANSTLYNVYAWDKPQQLGGKEYMIGTLKLNGSLISSKFGDKDLYFRHQRQDDDLKLHPEWEPYCPRYSLDGKCPFQKLMQ